MTPHLLEAVEVNVSRETLEKLSTFVALLQKWSPKINLISKRSNADLENRHILDSAQLWTLAPEQMTDWLDLGSGGGFPGLVIAIIASEKQPDMRVTLVESDLRKATFLRTVIRETEIRAEVIANRIQNLDLRTYDVISARALAELPDLLAFANPHRHENTKLLFHKGQTWRNEIDRARSKWRFRCDTHASITDPNAVILEIHELSHV